MAMYLVVMTRTRVVKEHAVVTIGEGSEHYARRNAPERANWQQDGEKVTSLDVVSCTKLTPEEF